ncbi:Condensin-2 complex subunit D3 [Porphyridium purpureum]|uniref:Condensin-2 complex subunit D3 n=1 Tax=Porphyridium purpureum TaxID=35688 RepID=A0A5J4YMI7_PORPP|nr:Condensin-2 complex subunit D3 [Porphyridium purpureum]|eukprot:POR8836..scf295_9
MCPKVGGQDNEPRKRTGSEQVTSESFGSRTSNIKTEKTGQSHHFADQIDTRRPTPSGTRTVGAMSWATLVQDAQTAQDSFARLSVLRGMYELLLQDSYISVSEEPAHGLASFILKSHRNSNEDLVRAESSEHSSAVEVQVYAAACYLLLFRDANLLASFEMRQLLVDLDHISRALMLDPPDARLKMILLIAARQMSMSRLDLARVDTEIPGVVIEALCRWLSAAEHQDQIDALRGALCHIALNSEQSFGPETNAPLNFPVVFLANLVGPCLNMRNKRAQGCLNQVLDAFLAAEALSARADAAIVFCQHVTTRAPDRAENRRLAAETMGAILQYVWSTHSDRVERFVLFLSHILGAKASSASSRACVVEVCSILLQSASSNTLFESIEVSTSAARTARAMLEILISSCSDKVSVIRAKAITSLASIFEKHGTQNGEDACVVRREVMRRLRQMTFEEQVLVRKILHDFCEDEKSGVRKAAVSMMHVLLLHAEWGARKLSCASPTPRPPGSASKDRFVSLLLALSKRCADAVPAVRKAAVEALSELAKAKHCGSAAWDNQIALICWIKGVLPRVMDTEAAVQEKALFSVEELIATPLGSPDDEEGGRGFACSLVLRLVLSAGHSQSGNLDFSLESDSGRFLAQAFEMLAEKRRLLDDLLYGLKRIALSEMDCASADERLLEMQGAWSLLGNAVHLFTDEAIADVFDAGLILSYGLGGERCVLDGFGGSVRHSAFQVLQKLPRKCFKQGSGLELGAHLASWIQKMLNPANEDELGDEDVDTLPSCSRIESILTLLAPAIQALAHCYSIGLENDGAKGNEFVSFVRSAMTQCDAHLTMVLSKDRRVLSANEKTRLLVAMCVISEIATVSPCDLNGEKVVTSRNVHCLQTALSNDAVTERLRAYAILSLGRCCLSENVMWRDMSVFSTREDRMVEGLSASVNRCIPAFVRELDSKNPACRSNALVVLCDLSRKFASLVEPYMSRLALSLLDSSLFVKRQSLVSFGALLQEDFLKPRSSPLLFRLLILTADSSEELRNMARFILTKVISAKNRRLIPLKFFDFVFFLNACSAFPTFNQECPLTEAERRRPEVMALRDEKLRFRIYDTLLRHCVDDAEMIKLPSRVCMDVFSQLDDVLGSNIGTTSGDGSRAYLRQGDLSGLQHALSDLLTILQWPLLRSLFRKAANLNSSTASTAAMECSSQEDGALLDAGVSECQAGKPLALRGISGKLLLLVSQTDLGQVQIPTLINVYRTLVQMKSPIQGTALECLLTLCKEYGPEWLSLSAVAQDETLRHEIAFEMSRATPDRSASLADRDTRRRQRELRIASFARQDNDDTDNTPAGIEGDWRNVEKVRQIKIASPVVVDQESEKENMKPENAQS